MIRALTLAAGITLLAVAHALADSTTLNFGQQKVEAGAGGALSSRSWDANILAIVSLDVAGRGRLGPLHLVRGRVQGKLELNGSGDGTRIPWMEFSVIPAIVGNTDDEGDHIGMRVLPVAITRNVRLDQNVTLRVTLVGLQSQTLLPLSNDVEPHWVAFLNLTADFLGYKMASQVSSLPDFHGGSVGSITNEIGLSWQPDPQMRIRFMAGYQLEASLGWRGEGSSAAFLVERKVYGQITADFLDLLGLFGDHPSVKLFLRAGQNHVSGGATPVAQSEFQALAGVIVSF